MYCEGDLVTVICDDGIVEVGPHVEPSIRRPTSRLVEGPRRRIADQWIVGRVELDICRAEVNEPGHLFSKQGDHIRQKGIQRGIRTLFGPEVGPQAWARQADLGNAIGVRPEIGEFIRRREAAPAKGAGDADAGRPLYALITHC